jgi:hypothetical protein
LLVSAAAVAIIKLLWPKKEATPDEQKITSVLKLSPFWSIPLAIVLTLGLGLLIAMLHDVLAGIAFVLILGGLLWGGAKNVPIQHEGVLTLLGMRIPIVLTEGWHPVIFGIMEIQLVNMRERVNEIPSETERKKEEGPNKDGFEVLAGVNIPGTDKDSVIELKVRAVLRWIVKHSFDFLSYDEKAIERALVNKAVDNIRTSAGTMSDSDFITQKAKIAGDAKKNIDALYACVTVNALDIPNAVYMDEEISKAKQERKKEEARTRAQQDELLGKNGTVSRIEETAERLIQKGMAPADAVKMATEIVQTQENRVEVKITRLEGTTGNPITDAAAAIAGAMGGGKAK